MNTNSGAPWNAIDKKGRCAGEYAMEQNQEDAKAYLLDTGVKAELLLGALERRLGRQDEKASSAEYLQKKVSYVNQNDDSAVLLDSDQKAVMMSWEAPLMEAHAHVLCSKGGDVLNIGFGLGIVDEAIQRRSPRSHTIVEAHPEVYARMLKLEWDKRPGVRIIFGRWQDVISKLGTYDGIFFDTYSEYYEDLREFHAQLPALLRKTGIYTYFNGLAGDNPFFYLVYCEICRLELKQLNLEAQFVPLPVSMEADNWSCVHNRYWQLDLYALPVVEWEHC